MAWLAGLWSDIYTNQSEGVRRLKTWSENPAFDSGEVFRSFWQLDLAKNDTLVFKFDITGDVTLLSSAIDIDEGGISYEVYVGGTEGGTFTPITPFKNNNKSTAPAITSNATVSQGGTLDLTGATLTDVTRVLAANANSRQSTVGSVDGDMRGFSAGTAYVVVTALDSVAGSSQGTIKWIWQNN